MKKILSLLVVMIITFNTLTISINAMNNKEFKEKNNLYELIAQYHIQADVLSNENSRWDENTKILGESELFDFEGKTSAYLYYLGNEIDNQGYIIIGVKNKYSPIIEFAYSGNPTIDSMLEVAKDKTKKREFKKIYDGGYEYYLESENNIYEITSDKIYVNKKEKYLVKSQSKEKEQDKHYYFDDEWQFFKDAYTMASNPPNGIITNPYTSESGYESVISSNVPSFSNTYFTTNSFSGYSGHCAPTSAINLMLYWYNRGYGFKYNNSWSTSFDLMHDYMGTDSSGTSSEEIENGLEAYLTTVGHSYDIDRVSNPSVQKMVDEINADYPFLFSAYGHNEYGDHTMMAFGYTKFTYYYGFTSTYLRIADAWSSSTGRYIHTTEGYSPNIYGREGIDFIYKLRP